jgi:hypothetical protein
MEIICLSSKERISDSVFDLNPYVAFLEPAFGGNHITEIIILISDYELEFYNMPVFVDYKQASNFASYQIFGVDVYKLGED